MGGVGGGGFGAVDGTQMPSLVPVAGPTAPSGGRPFADCHCLRALAVETPNVSSGPMKRSPRAASVCSTHRASAPRLPCPTTDEIAHVAATTTCWGAALGVTTGGATTGAVAATVAGGAVVVGAVVVGVVVVVVDATVVVGSAGVVGGAVVDVSPGAAWEAVPAGIATPVRTTSATSARRTRRTTRGSGSDPPSPNMARQATRRLLGAR